MFSITSLFLFPFLFFLSFPQNERNCNQNIMGAACGMSSQHILYTSFTSVMTGNTNDNTKADQTTSWWRLLYSYIPYIIKIEILKFSVVRTRLVSFCYKLFDQSIYTCTWSQKFKLRPWTTKEGKLKGLGQWEQIVWWVFNICGKTVLVILQSCLWGKKSVHCHREHFRVTWMT